MPDPINWYALGRVVNDPTTIDENIDAKILAHNFDPSAHGQSDEAVYNHRISSLLDHVNYSIYNIKIHPEARTIKAFVDVGGAAEFTDLDSAIEYVNALGGGKIFAKNGHYSLNSDLLLYSNITIEGEDNDATIIDFGNGNRAVKATGTPSNRLRNIHLFNLQFTGSSYYLLGRYAFDYVDDFSVKECKFKDNYAALQILDCTIGKIEGNYVQDSLSIQVLSINKSISIKENHFKDMYITSVMIDNGLGVTVKDNTFENIQAECVTCFGNDAIIVDNHIISAVHDCIVIQDAVRNVTIDGNVIIHGDGSFDAIKLGINAYKIGVSRNRLIGPFYRGIFANKSHYSILLGNIMDNATIGIDIRPSSIKNIVLGNMLRDATVPLSDSGIATEIGHNILT